MLKCFFHRWLAISCLSVLIVACGGGGGGSGGGNTGTGTTSSSNSSSPSSTSPSAPATSGGPSVHLAWVIPTTRTDGSPLIISAIREYRLYYTRDGSSTSDDTVVTVSGGSTTSTDLSLPVAGTYTFAITAVDTSGIESGFSEPLTVTLN